MNHCRSREREKGRGRAVFIVKLDFSSERIRRLDERKICFCKDHHAHEGRIKFRINTLSSGLRAF